MQPGKFAVHADLSDTTAINALPMLATPPCYSARIYISRTSKSTRPQRPRSHKSMQTKNQNRSQKTSQTRKLVGVDVPRLVRLAPLTESITAEAGWVIDWWIAGQNCPECGKRGMERAGAEFQHMNRCTDCCHVWTPETWYLRIRLPNDKGLATQPARQMPEKHK